jgi:hypothetical protein
MRILRCWALALLLASAAQVPSSAQGPSAAAAPVAEDPCLGFKWDLSRERALFATAGASLPAGKDLASAPDVVPNHLYRVMLLPASHVVFPATPGRTSPGEGTYAGVFTLTVPAAGKYRVAIDSDIWIDIAAEGRLVPPSDYEGQRNCRAPRKIVEFILEGKGLWVLQLSGASQAAVRLTITPAYVG